MIRMRLFFVLLLVALLSISCQAAPEELIEPKPVGYFDFGGQQTDFYDFSLHETETTICESFVVTVTDTETSITFSQVFEEVNVYETEVVYTLKDDYKANVVYTTVEHSLFGWDDALEIDDELEEYSNLAFAPFLSFNYDLNTDLSVPLNQSVYAAIENYDDDKYRDIHSIDTERCADCNHKDDLTYLMPLMDRKNKCNISFEVASRVGWGAIDSYSSRDVIYHFNEQTSNGFEMTLTEDDLFSIEQSEAEWVKQDPTQITTFDGTFSYRHGMYDTTTFIEFLSSLPATIYYENAGDSATFGRIVLNK